MGLLANLLFGYRVLTQGKVPVPSRNYLELPVGSLTDDPANNRTIYDPTSGSGFVPGTRTLTAGAGLTGGGALSADRTFNVIANGDGSIVVNANDIQLNTTYSALLSGATASATPSTLALRNGSGASAFAFVTLTSGIVVPPTGAFAQTQAAPASSVTPVDMTWTGQSAHSGDALAGGGFKFTVGAAGDSSHSPGNFKVECGAAIAPNGWTGKVSIQSTGTDVFAIQPQIAGGNQVVLQGADLFELAVGLPSPVVFMAAIPSPLTCKTVGKFQVGSSVGGGVMFTVDSSGSAIGLYGATPVVRPSRVGQLTDSTTGTSGGTLVDVGSALVDVGDPDPALVNANFAALAARCNDDLASLAARLNAIELALHNLGVTA